MPKSGRQRYRSDSCNGFRTRDTSPSSSDTSFRRTSRRHRIGGRLRSAGFVHRSLSLGRGSFCGVRPRACEPRESAPSLRHNPRDLTLVKAESKPNTFAARSFAREGSGDVHAHIACGMWMRGEFFLANHSPGIIYTKRLNLTGGGAHDSDSDSAPKVGASHSSATSPRERERAERANGVRPCHGHAALHTCEYNEVVVWRCVSARSACHTTRDPHAAFALVHPPILSSQIWIIRTPTIVRPAWWPSGSLNAPVGATRTRWAAVFLHSSHGWAARRAWREESLSAGLQAFRPPCSARHVWPADRLGRGDAKRVQLRIAA